jgi:hypothetical protein
VLSGYLGGWLEQDDHISLTAIFRNGQAGLGQLVIGPVTPAQRGNVSQLAFSSTTGFIPAGTRSVDILLQATRSSGAYNDGYADNISFAVVPEQSTALAGLGSILGVCLHRNRRLNRR